MEKVFCNKKITYTKANFMKGNLMVKDKKKTTSFISLENFHMEIKLKVNSCILNILMKVSLKIICLMVKAKLIMY